MQYRGFIKEMRFIRSALSLAILISLTFVFVVFFKHGPEDPTEFADGVRQEITAITSAFRGFQEHLPEAPFVAPES